MFATLRYRFNHFMFRWVTDNEGDIGICFFGIVTLLKYKEHTIIRKGGKSLENAGKYQGKKE